MAITGGCLCGAVRYSIVGVLRNARSCHCAQCRKAFSGAASAYAEVDSDQFSWSSGTRELAQFTSVAGWGLGFCRVCGSTLCGFQNGRVHGVALGSVDGDPGVTIQWHQFVASKAPWHNIGDSAPQYDAGPPEGG